MILYDVNLKEINEGDELQVGENITILEKEGNDYYVQLGRKKYNVKELPTYALSKDVIVLVDFEKVE